MRFFDEDKQMNNQELDNYFLNKRKDYSMWEKENSMIDIDDVDTDLLKKEIDKGYENKRIPFEYSNHIDVIKNLDY